MSEMVLSTTLRSSLSSPPRPFVKDVRPSSTLERQRRAQQEAVRASRRATLEQRRAQAAVDRDALSKREQFHLAQCVAHCTECDARGQVFSYLAPTVCLACALTSSNAGPPLPFGDDGVPATRCLRGANDCTEGECFWIFAPEAPTTSLRTSRFAPTVCVECLHETARCATTEDNCTHANCSDAQVSSYTWYALPEDWELAEDDWNWDRTVPICEPCVMDSTEQGCYWLDPLYEDDLEYPGSDDEEEEKD